jgi:amino acid transporter
MLNRCLLENGDLAAAKTGYDDLLKLDQSRENGEIYWIALYDRGRIAEREGDRPGAIGYYQRSIEVIEQQRASINTEANKIGFVGDKQAVYARLISLLLQERRDSDAFEAVERSKSRALNQGVLNHFGVRLVAILNDLSVTVHIIGVLIIVGAIFWMAPLQPASFLTTAVNSNGRSPYWWAFLLGLLQAQWTFTGFDASAHMAEETHDPRRRAPWGIVLSVAVSGFVGYLLLISLTLAAGDLQGILNARDADGNVIPAAIAVLQKALSPRFGSAMGALASMAMWFCGLSCIASASRALFSLARDNGTPASGLLRRVHPKHGTPGPAIWAIVGASLAAMVWSGAIPVVTSLSTVALYVAYVIPLILGLRARRRGHPWTTWAVWNLGAAGPMVNTVAILYTIFICVVLVMPPNLLAGQTFAGLVLALAALWFFKARSYYAGPDWSGKERDQ